MDGHELVRFGVSMSRGLTEKFDETIARSGYHNRSEAIRDLVRKEIIKPDLISNEAMVAGTIVIVYDHHATDLPNSLIALQHHYHQEIRSTMHIHLDFHQCLEIVVVQGQYKVIRSLHDSIRVQKGVQNTELSVMHIGLN